jgi:hypothetical protein
MSVVKSWWRMEHPLIKTLLLIGIISAIINLVYSTFYEINPKVIWSIASPFIFWIFLIYGFSFLFKLKNKGLTKKEKFSQKEIQKILNEKVPKYFPFLKGSLIFLMIIFVVIISLIIGFGMMFLQRAIFNTPEILSFLPFNSTMIIFIVAPFFSSIFLYYLILLPIIHKFPRFERYSNRRDIRFGDIAKNKYEKDMKLLIRVFSIVSTVTIALMILAIFNYSYLDEEGAHINSFLSLTEKDFTWGQINKVVVKVDYREITNVRILYYLILEDGSKIDIFINGLPKNIDRIEEELMAADTPFEIDPNAQIEIERLKKAEIYSGLS